MIHLLRVFKSMQGKLAYVRISEGSGNVTPIVTAMGTWREGRNKMNLAYYSGGFMEKRLKLSFEDVDNKERKKELWVLKRNI